MIDERRKGHGSYVYVLPLEIGGIRRARWCNKLYTRLAVVIVVSTICARWRSCEDTRTSCTYTTASISMVSRDDLLVLVLDLTRATAYVSLTNNLRTETVGKVTDATRDAHSKLEMA